MFGIVSTDHGSMPFEYLPAAADTYVAGQALVVKTGKLAAITPDLTTVPPYMCMADKTCADGEALQVIRVTEDTIWGTQLTAMTSGAKPGALLQVSDGGLGVNGSAEGSFEVKTAEGTANESRVTGRFVPVPTAAVP